MNDKCTYADTIDFLYKRLDAFIEEAEANVDKYSKTLSYLDTVPNIEDNDTHLLIKKKCKRTLSKWKSKLTKFNNLKQHKFVYNYVINNYNEMLIEEVIKNGYTIKLGHKLGWIRIYKCVRKRKRIDWKASFENKANLVAQNKKLWDKETKTGIKWFVYHTDKFNYPFRWLKTGRNFVNSYGWYLKFTTGPNGVQQKALKYFKYNPAAKLKHKLNEEYSN